MTVYPPHGKASGGGAAEGPAIEEVLAVLPDCIDTLHVGVDKLGNLSARTARLLAAVARLARDQTGAYPAPRRGMALATPKSSYPPLMYQKIESIGY